MNEWLGKTAEQMGSDVLQYVEKRSRGAADPAVNGEQHGGRKARFGDKERRCGFCGGIAPVLALASQSASQVLIQSPNPSLC